MNQRCQWPNTKEVCLFICNWSWLGAGLLPMVIQGPKSLLSWISIIPSLLLGTEEEGEEDTHSISENHACCLTSHSYELGTTVPVICCPLETTQLRDGRVGAIRRAVGHLGHSGVTFLPLTSKQAA